MLEVLNFVQASLWHNFASHQSLEHDTIHLETDTDVTSPRSLLGALLQETRPHSKVKGQFRILRANLRKLRPPAPDFVA
ncbi:hypothetical protein OUZ56_003557 [Daphnia magna]|uniref:Uncharacterized protein n=1 Tax=Daphnia magna TaxID=35525 RepID=A0ABR0A925_9CRUS|nr:hypothetical protein OUZ56_003557 [Daphnia magna]